MTLPCTTSPSPNKALGVAAVAGMVGLAVATREHLERFECHRVRRPEVDVARVAARVASLLGTHGCTALALVDTDGRHHAVWVSDLAEWCQRLAEVSGRAWHQLVAAEVRAKETPASAISSNWRLMAALALRYPALRGYTRVGFPEGLARYQRHRRERYWTPAFLALAAVDQALADAIGDEDFQP